MPVFGDELSIPVLEAWVIDKLKKKKKIEVKKVQAIGLQTYRILNSGLYPKYIDRFYQHVDDKKQYDIDKKFSFHLKAKVQIFWAYRVAVNFSHEMEK